MGSRPGRNRYTVTTFLPGLIIFMYVNTAFGNPDVRYVPIGDSYTIGTGAALTESWPLLLSNHLRKEGVPVQLVDNPARNGFTTKDVLQIELPAFEKDHPDFATLMIGVNDWVHGVPSKIFRRQLAAIMDRMLFVLPQKDNLLIITIPDFSVSPKGALFANGRDISSGIKEFNDIICEEAQSRGLTVADLYPYSQTMNADASLFSSDGFHPSALGYYQWEKIIFPSAMRLLSAHRSQKF